MKNSMHLSIFVLALVLGGHEASAQEAPPTKALITKQVIQDIRAFIDTDIVRRSIENQNIKYGHAEQSKIDSLDKEWRTESELEDQPLIAATLSSPLSSYLTRMESQSLGLYTEMIAMDQNGLNVGQSDITTDYWQGDEAKWQKTYLVGPDAVFVDDPEYDKDLGIWRDQVNLAVSDPVTNKPIGAMTIEVNLSELQRRDALKAFKH